MAGIIQSTMIRASAGSGKTFQLANRFLALMVLGIAPEKIIALTFTRKAAGEFTGRIMTRLAAGAASDKGATELAGQLSEVIGGTASIPPLVTGGPVELPELDTAFFQEKLEQLIAVLDRLALSTLDSYFVRIVRNFHLELGLSGFDLMEDAAISSERSGVMEAIFSNRRTTQQDRDAFLQSFKQATWGEEENRLCQTLEDFVTTHQNRWLSAPEEGCWGGADLLWPEGCPYPSGNIVDLAKQLRGMLGEPYSPYKTYMNGWLKVCDILEVYQPGAPVKANAQLTRAISLWDQYQQGGLIEEKNKYEISAEMGKVMTSLIGVYIRSEIEICMKRTQGLYRVISAYEDRYQEQVRNRGRLCFSDLTLLLAGKGAMQMWAEDERNLIDFRLDARYDHWLLDEFQDTSRPQWQAVENLIDEIMQDADGQRSVFVVGDSKQSIYGWRGGEPRLFDDLKDHYGERLADWDMDRSYRSSRPVLDLVNAVCDLSDPKWCEIFPADAIGRWKYHTHVPDKDKQGHTLVLETTVDFKQSSNEEKTAARYACMKSLIERVSPLKGGMTCAVLVSKNAHVTEIVDFLRRELPDDVPVASESESTVADGPEGALILDLFRWLRNPAHEFGYIHVSLSPLGEIITGLCASDKPQHQWLWLTEEVARKGVESLLSRIISALREKQGVDISAYGQSRLDEIQAAAKDFSIRGGTLDDWVLMLEARSLRETTHEGLIQVMTIHKCKGLGFDMVILPELGGYKEFTDVGRLGALEHKGEMGVTEYVIKKPSKEICEADPFLSKMMETWAADQCYERFCNLYVALTRAKQATYCILDPVKDDWHPRKKYDDWIREATSGCGQDELVLAGEPYNVLYGSGDWLEVDENMEKEKEVQDISVILKPVVMPRVARKIASKTKKQEPNELLKNSKGMHFGNMVHGHFEKITWLDEMTELPDTSSARAVTECLEQPGIRPYFERPDGEFQLLREQPFETRQDGQWVSGVIDRAVILLKDGQPSSITIIDFKTDRDETPDSLREKYTPQLQTYRAALQRITGVAEERITCYLLATALEEMVEL